MKLAPVILIDLDRISPEPDFANMLLCISNQHVLSQGDTRLKNMHGAVATHSQAGGLSYRIHTCITTISIGSLFTRWDPTSYKYGYNSTVRGLKP